jgi:transcriptional regulator with XRE-family HTH domain
MDDQRVGRIVRALRRRLGWRQLDLAKRAGCSQNLISLIERGHMDRVSLRTLRGVLGAVDAWAVIELRWRGAALDRLLDEGHAFLIGAVAECLRTSGWLVELDVTYSEFGERGSIDILAFHPTARILLVIEAKTDVPSAEGTIRKLDEKQRLAASIAGKRFGWHTRTVARLLVMPESSTLRARVMRHRAVFAEAFPVRNVAVKAWLASPVGTISGLWFLSNRDPRVDKAARSGGQRIRRPQASQNKHDQAA